MRKVFFNLTILAILLLMISCSSIDSYEEQNSVESFADDNKLTIIEKISPFEGLNVLEEITFIQESNDQEMQAALIHHEEANQYSIEVFIPDSNTFQTLTFVCYTNRPSNLQATTVMSYESTTSLALITLNNVNIFNETKFDNAFDTVFHWNSTEQLFNTEAHRSSTARFENVAGTEFYATTLIINENLDYKVIIYNEDFTPIQFLFFERESDYWGGVSVPLDFRDLNNDGYGDLWKFTYVAELGARNMIYIGFTWDFELQRFVEVAFIGFDWLMQPHYVSDGYISNYIRDYTANESVIQRMVWEGHQLILISEEYIDDEVLSR